MHVFVQQILDLCVCVCVCVCVCNLFLRKLNAQVGGDARNNMVLQINFFVYDKSAPSVIFAFFTSSFIMFP